MLIASHSSPHCQQFWKGGKGEGRIIEILQDGEGKNNLRGKEDERGREEDWNGAI